MNDRSRRVSSDLVHVQVPADATSTVSDSSGTEVFTGLVALEYRPCRPFWVQLTLVVDGTVHALQVPRDLMLTGAGVSGVDGEQVWRAGPFQRIGSVSPGCFGLRLHLGASRVELMLPAPTLAAFLRLATQLVPVGAEADHVDWDDQLRQLSAD